jgi:acetyl esterase/lipase
MKAFFCRHSFLWAVFACFVCMLHSFAGAAESKVRVSTYVYKSVDGLDIKADVHRPDDGVQRPVAVWIHGGALIMGHRVGISQRVKRMLLDEGYALVSIDYRLAPETKLPAIIEDMEDAFRWLRSRGPELFNVDVSKIAVLGGSAGGYLTLATGYRVQPPPTVLVAFWGYGDLIGDWYSRPSPHPRHHNVKISEEEAARFLSFPPVSDSRDRQGNGGAFYQYCRQTGLWPSMVSGWDPHEEPAKYTPFMPVKNVTPDYPPTLLIHGTDDTDVPYEQSLMMAEQFRKHKVPHELISIANGEHGLGGGDPQKIDAAYRAAGEFVQRFMGR